MPESRALALIPAQQSKLDAVVERLEASASDLLKVLPPSLTLERFMTTSTLAIAKNPDILDCTPASIVASVIEAAEIGLEPTGSLNRAWLVPFKDDGIKKAQLMIGYQGYADLMRDSGKVTRIGAEVVYEGDTFRTVKGSEQPRIIHTPRYKTEDPTRILYVYAVAWFADGGQQFEVMTREQVEGIRAKSKQRNGATWTQNWPQMARKTAIRRLANYVPLTDRAQKAIARDDEREYGSQEPAEPSAPRAGALKDRIRDNTKALTASEAPGAAATSEPLPTSTPETSAAQQPPDAAQQPDTVEGEVREVQVCGNRMVPVEGSVQVCQLEAGHDGMHAKGAARWNTQA